MSHLAGFLVLVLTLSLIFVFSTQIGAESTGSKNSLGVHTVSEETVTLVPSENSYTIIFSSDTNSLDLTIATELRTRFLKAGIRLDVKVDTSANESEFEILLGNTNRSLSRDLKAACTAAVSGDDLAWGFAYRDGKFAYAAKDDTSFSRGQGDLFANYITEENHLIAEEGLWVICTLTRAEYDAEVKAEQDRLEAEKEQARLERIEELKDAISKFTLADFTDRAEVTLEYAQMPSSIWGKPNLYPTTGEHPRLGVTSDTLEDIKEYLKTSEGKRLYEKLKEIVESDFDGILSAPTMHTSGRVGFHNMSEGGLAVIEARAFLYLLTGDEQWGYDAILSMKNYFKTVEIGWINSDQCREFGRIIFCGAEVYDWCYDLMSEDDKNQFMIAFTDIVSGTAAGTEYAGLCQSGNAYMEVGYPPSKQGSVSGHGSEHQILRDYLSVAIAIFDENPSWYEYVGGRVYNDYVVTRNYYYQSGTYQQGVNTYAAFRHNADIWSAWMLLCATGENPYVPELEHVTMSFFEYELPDGSFFGTGDGVRLSAVAGEMGRDAVIIAALYGNTVLRQRVLNLWANFNGFKGETIELSYASMINFSAAYWNKTGVTTGTPLYDGEEPVSYHGHPIAQLIARSEWDSADAPAVFMKIGERSTGNHEHADAGSFQIFYKGLYSGESGVYNGYGSTHFVYYHQATVAHNSLLVFNPDLAVYELDGTTVDNSSNFTKSFYSGGQRSVGEIATLDKWLASTNHETGTVTGMEYAFKEDGRTDYAYLAGDISAAYQATQASNVVRRMFTLFTEDESYPMYFIVYDQITAVQDNFVKKFLLHTPTEPVIDEENKTVTVTDKDGKLVLQSLIGGDKFEALGGEGRNYLINGIQCAVSNTPSDGNWGRVEISNTGTLSSDFLNFIYVTDAANDEKLTPVTIDTEKLSGMQLGTDVVIFAKSTDDRNTEELLFNTEGSGLNRYFITGIYEGTWHVSVDGVTVAHCVSTEEGGMISFYAPAGEVSIKPGGDIASSNGGRIIYNSFGGIVPDDAPLVYEIGVPVKLPETIVRGNDEFLGWYTSPTFEEDTRITEVLAENKGKFNVYASFRSYPVLEDYEDKDFIISGFAQQVEDLLYYGDKEGSRFETVKDESGNNTYLRISHTASDMEIYATQTPSSYIGSYTKLTFELDLAKDGDKTPIGSLIRLRESTKDKIATVLSIGSDGSVALAGQKTIFSLTENFQKAIITVDFAESTMTAYNIFGDEIGTISFAVPSGSATKDTLEWASMLTCTFNWWIGSGGESFLVDNIKVYCGDYHVDTNDLPENTVKIKYDTNGGDFAKKPTVYAPVSDESFALPTDISRDDDEFLGWYTTPSFEEGTEITEIPNGSSGEFAIYAKWRTIFIEEDYEVTSPDITEADETVNGVTYQTSGKPLASFVIMTAGNLDRYLAWCVGSSDPSITVNNTQNNISTMNDSSISYTLTLSKNAAAKLPELAFTVIGRNNSDGESASDFEIYLGKLSEDGSFTLGASDTVAATVGVTPTTLRIVLDFEEGSVKAYNKWGVLLASVPMPDVPEESGTESHLEWKDCFTENLLSIRVTNGSENTDNSIRIFGIKIEEGNAFAPKDGTEPTVPECNEHYDNDKDGNCDFCEEPTGICREHTDNDADGLCDICGEKTPESDVVVDMGPGIWGGA